MTPAVVVHATTVHDRRDTRILARETWSLARAGYDVRLLVADARPDEVCEGVTVTSIGPCRNRLDRATRGSVAMLRAVLRARPQVAHIHDPELLAISPLLRLAGIATVYDCHEDLAGQVRHKRYLSAPARRVLGAVVGPVERALAATTDRVVVAEEHLRHRPGFRTATVVRNYPRVDELVDLAPTAPGDRPNRATGPTYAYVGGMSADRGTLDLLDAIAGLDRPDARFLLAGPELDRSVHERLAGAAAGDPRVTVKPRIGRAEVAEVLSRATVGIVTLRDVPNYRRSLPTKLLEYWSMGLAVVAPDLPGTREVVAGAEAAAVLYRPGDADDLRRALASVADPARAATMGHAGLEAVRNGLTWASEATTLVDLYRDLLARRSR